MLETFTTEEPPLALDPSAVAAVLSRGCRSCGTFEVQRAVGGVRSVALPRNRRRWHIPHFFGFGLVVLQLQ